LRLKILSTDWKISSKSLLLGSIREGCRSGARSSPGIAGSGRNYAVEDSSPGASAQSGMRFHALNPAQAVKIVNEELINIRST
jgi:hypothetical protein